VLSPRYITPNAVAVLVLPMDRDIRDVVGCANSGAGAACIHAPGDNSMSHSTLQVWVVDDEPATCWVLARALGHAGMAPRAFEAAESALEALQSVSPAVLVTVIQLASQSGPRSAGPVFAASEWDGTD
jgi:PleD family two-component response regulator